MAKAGRTTVYNEITSEEKLAQVQQAVGVLRNSLPNFTA